MSDPDKAASDDKDSNPPVTSQSNNGVPPPTTAIDPNKIYSRAEVAALIGQSEVFVQLLWDNWRNQAAGKRMNYILQTGKGSAKVSSGAHIRQYLNNYGGPS